MKRTSLWKLALATLLVVMIVATVAGCGGGGSGPGTSGEKVTVRFMTSETDPPSVEVYNQVIKDFEAQHPNVKISLEMVGADDLYTKLPAAITAQAPPDISQIDPEQAVEFIKEGHLAPVDDLVNSIGPDDFIKGSVIKVDGHAYSIPYAGSGTVMWIRKDLFDKYNVKVPTNWDELLAAAKALTKDTNGDGKPDIYGIALPAGQNKWTGHVFNMFMWQNGQTMFDKNLKVTFNTPATVEALQMYKDLCKYAPSDIGSYSYYETINAFATGRVAMAPYMGRLLSQVATNNPKLLANTVAIPMPAKKLSANFGSWNCYVMFKDAKHPNEAKEFLKFLTTGPQATKFLLTVPGHLVPPLKSLMQAQDFWNDKFVKENEANIKTVFKASESALAPVDEAGAIVNNQISPERAYNPYISTIISRNIRALTVQKVVLQNMAPQEAVAWGQQEMEKVVQEMSKK